MDVALSVAQHTVKVLLFSEARQQDQRPGRWAQDPELDRRQYLYGSTRQEEETLNLCLVAEVFVQLFARGFGFLSSIWATVVLLGSFGTMLHMMDFWFATVIVFIQTAGIIGFNPYPEARFFSEVPQAYIDLYVSPRMQTDHTWSTSGRSPVLKKIVFFCKFFRDTTLLVSYLAYAALLISIVPEVAAITCITLSIIRLVAIAGKDYRGGNVTPDVSGANLKRPALIFFYALVLTQGAFLVLHLTLWSVRRNVARSLRKKCGFDTKDTTKLIDKYIGNTLDTCIQVGVSKTIKRNLVSFAQDLLKSESDDGHLTAVCILHTLLEQDAYRASVISQVESSQQCLVKLFEILSSKSLADGTTKAYAAAVVAKLATNIHLTDMPGAIQSVLSMLEPPPSLEMVTHTTNVNNGQNVANDQNRDTSLLLIPTSIRPESKPLIVHSLLILGQFACDPDNCAKICSTKGLVSMMIAPLCNSMRFLATRDDDPTYIELIEVMKESIGVLTKLVRGTGGQTSSELREQIVGSDGSIKQKLTNITGKAAGDTQNTNLLVYIITTLCQDEATRGNFQHMSEFVDELLDLCFGDTKNKVRIVSELLGLFFSADNSEDATTSAVLGLFFSADNSEDAATSAAQALAALARSSEGDCKMIMEAEIAGGGQTVIQKLTDMLGTVTHRKQRAAVARMLSHLCTISTTQGQRDNLQPLRSKFTTLLRVIMGAKAEQEEVELDVQLHLYQNQALDEQNPQHHWCNKAFPPLPCIEVFRRILDRHNRFKEMGRYPEIWLNHVGMEVVAERKSVAALLSLSVQMISADLLPGTAAQVIPMNHIWFVKKLKIIIKRNREATPDCVEIIRAMAQLCIWIIEKNHIAAECFRDETIHEELETSAEAMLELERRMLLTGSIPDPANYEIVSSIVKRANRLIVPVPQPSAATAAMRCCC